MMMPQSVPNTPLLDVRGLRTVFHTKDGQVRAVDGLDFSVYPGEIVGLVGESGSGKTVTALSILGLVQPPGERIAGRIQFAGMPVHEYSEEQLSSLRGAQIGMIFQDPKIRLNPVFSIGAQITETLQVHLDLSYASAWRQMLRLLGDVDLGEAGERAHSYPHELSMGQAQRVMIAMAMALDPRLIIADEPTSSLDATIQAQILDLLEKYQRDKGTAILLISHDLAVVARLAQRVIVLYAGQVVEQAPVMDIFHAPYHPYTRGLIAAIPANQIIGERLKTIRGSAPDARDLPPACRFAPRCDARLEHGLEICTSEEPQLRELSQGHWVRCWLFTSKGDAHQAPLSFSDFKGE